MKMQMQFEFSFNRSQIAGAVDVLPINTAYGPVNLSFNGEFYNDDLFELIYRSRVRKQYGAMVIRISEELDKLYGHYAGFSPIRACFIMGKFELTRSGADA